MQRTHVHSRRAAAVALMLGLSPALMAQSPLARFTGYGTGCPGSQGVPTLSVARLPVPGATVDIRLDQARPGALAFLLVGLTQAAADLGPLGMPGCTRLLAIDDVRTLVTDPNGHAASRFAVPLDGRFLGTRLFFQAVVHDPGGNTAGFVTSAGAELVIGAEPQVQVRTFGPTTTSSTGVLEIRGQAFGSDPRAFCIRAFDSANNDQALLIGESLTTAGNEQVLRARVSHVGPRFVSGSMMLMRGVARDAVPTPRGRLRAPERLWAAEGLNLPENNTALGVLTIERPEAAVTDFSYDWTWRAKPAGATWGENEMELRFPLNCPCTGTLDWPVLTRITMNADVRIRVDGAPPAEDRWFDTLFDSITVRTAGTNGLNVVDDHAWQLRDLYSSRYGSVPFRITGGLCPDDPTHCCIVISPNVGHSIIGTGTAFGGMRIDCPERSDVFLAQGLFPMPGTVTTLDTNAATGAVASFGAPAASVASSPGGGAAIVLDLGFPQSLRYFDAANGSSLGITPLPGLPQLHSLDVSARGYALALGGGALVSVALSTLAPVSTLVVSPDYDRVVCSHNGRFALATSRGSRNVLLVEIDPAGVLTPRTTLLAGTASNPGVGAIACNPSWPAVWTANLDGSLTEFELRTDSNNSWVFRVLGTVPGVMPALQGFSTGGYDLVFRDAGERAYLMAAPAFPTVGWQLLVLEASEGDGAYVAASAPFQFTSDLLAPFPGAKCLAVSDLGRKLFVSNFDQVRIYDLDAATGAPTQLRSTPPSGNVLAITRRLR